MQITKCFEILEVDNDAPWHVIKKSYHSLHEEMGFILQLQSIFLKKLRILF